MYKMIRGREGKLAVEIKAEKTQIESTRACDRLEMSEKTAMKTGDLNHEKSLHCGSYGTEN